MFRLTTNTWIKTAGTVTSSSSKGRKTKTRIVAGVIGGAIAAMGLFAFDHFPGREREIQLVVWTMFVLLIVIGPNREHFRQRWFWKACLLGGLSHVLIVFSLKGALPFSSIGVAILISIPEAVLLLYMFGVISREAP